MLLKLIRYAEPSPYRGVPTSNAQWGALEGEGAEWRTGWRQAHRLTAPTTATVSLCANTPVAILFISTVGGTDGAKGLSLIQILSIKTRKQSYILRPKDMYRA